MLTDFNDIWWECTWLFWGTAVAAPPPFRPGNPALYGSRPLVTPYYCRLGGFAVFCVYVCWLYFFCSLCTLCVPSVLWYCWLGLLTCKNRRPYNLYCVGGDVKPCSINQLLMLSWQMCCTVLNTVANKLQSHVAWRKQWSCYEHTAGSKLTVNNSAFAKISMMQFDKRRLNSSANHTVSSLISF